MKKFLKWFFSIFIGGFIGLIIAAFILDDSGSKKEENTPLAKETNYSNDVNKYQKLKSDLDLITELQNHFYNKPLTKKLLDKYPSFNTITKDFRPVGGNIYYIYSKKYNIELKVKNNEVVMLWEGSRFR